MVETYLSKGQARGVRYPLVGEARGCHFAGTNSEPRKLTKNAHAAQRLSHHHDPGVFPGVGLAPPRRTLAGRTLC